MIQPIQKFIDAENYDLSQLEEHFLNYYTFDGELYSMPFNSSNPILYYNKDMFREAGLDPERTPRTYEEVEVSYARALTKDGKYGVSFALYGWFMEQFHANAGVDYVDNGNGVLRWPNSLVDGEVGVRTMEWWKRMVDEGISSQSRAEAHRTRKPHLSQGRWR